MKQISDSKDLKLKFKFINNNYVDHIDKYATIWYNDCRTNLYRARGPCLVKEVKGG